MSIVLRGLRSVFLWLLPVVVLIIVVAGGFVYWCVATEAGTRWALDTAAQQFDGHASGVQGSLWHGVRVADLAVDLPGVALRARDLHLQASWPELSGQRLHINDLSAQSLDIDLTDAPQPDSAAAPFEMPALPLKIAVDRLALGRLTVQHQGVPIAVDVRKVVASLAVTERGAELGIENIDLGHELLQSSTQGTVKLLSLADPWPLQARLTTRVTGQGADSPLCVRRYVGAPPAGAAPVPETQHTHRQSPPEKDDPVEECSVDIVATIDGSLDQLGITLAGQSEGISLDAQATLLPRGAFLLKDAVLALQLADGSSLNADVNWESWLVDGAVHDRLRGSVQSSKLDVGRLAGGIIPAALVTTSGRFDVELLDHRNLLSADVALEFADDTRWNGEKLSGVFKTKLLNTADDPVAAGWDLSAWLILTDMSMDLHLGKNHLQANGSLGTADSRLTLNLLAPHLAAFWPGLPGGAQLQGEFRGLASEHSADLKAVYTPEKSATDSFATEPTTLQVHVAGGWGDPDPAVAGGRAASGWRGTVSKLTVTHGGLSAQSQRPVSLTYVPGVATPRVATPSTATSDATASATAAHAWQWQVGPAAVRVALPSGAGAVINHKGSRGAPGRWETQGGVDQLTVSAALVEELRAELGLDKAAKEERGSVKLATQKKRNPGSIVLELGWDLAFSGVLEGQVHIRRVSGDLIVPGDPGFPLGLNVLTLDMTARRASPSTSTITADLNVVTDKMGRIAASASTLLHVGPDGSFVIKDNEPKTVTVDADIADLGWTSLFLGDATELGGALQAKLHAQSGPNGTWATGGTITGQKIRLVRIDDGVRLLDGTLAAHIDNNRIVLDSLKFPALLRVTPKEWRTNEWVTTNPDAKGGSLTLSGDWDLFESTGTIHVDLYRYPVLQRSDRYAMVTGKLTVDAQLPKISIVGSVTADAGWFDLDMLGGIPTVDNDVVVIRPGQDVKSIAVPTEISMDLTVDLGPRFYLTGYGVNSGLVGKVRIIMANGRLTGEGALRTRGGAIEIYGQRLQLRRGTITFQGDIASPVLNIEALRTGGAVEAGVRVAGTARRPRIDLVSYPDVSDVEKLSWLLLGRPPDEGGGDAALLFSVGTSLLGSGEPFYRQLGLDEVSIRSGELGSTGSILPVESVVSKLDSGTSDIERKFVMAAKTFSNGITLSIEQALSDAGTVGRVSYQLAKGLTAELSIGTVNGIALIYRVFFKD